MIIAKLEGHQQWPLAEKIIQTLNKRGFEAYLAGGCVRDLLLGRAPQDLDVATSARPDEVEPCFLKTLDVGREFGTLVVVEGNQQIELTTFRQDGDYEDGRHPTSVEFSNLEQDSRRRDFTINAMYLDIGRGEVIDFHGGQEDLRNKIVRAVGEARQRFTEDHLRILRALRFATQLNFTIEDDTARAVKSMARQLLSISRERIYAEMEKICESTHFPRGLELLQQHDILQNLFAGHPLFAANHLDLLKQNLQKFPLRGILPVFSLLAYLAWRLEASVDFVQRLHQLNWPNKLASAVEDCLQQWPQFLYAPNFYERARLMAGPRGLVLLNLWQVHSESLGSGQQELLQFVERYGEVCDEQGELPKPWVSGQDLLDLGLAQGPLMGEVIAEVHRRQIQGELESRQQALKFVQQTYCN